MKSDWDDAPDYLRNKKRPDPWRMVAILGVGSAITWGVIALFAKPIVINVDQLKQAIHVDGKPLFSQQPAPQPYSELEPPPSLPSVPVDPPPQRIQHHQPSQADIEWAEKSKAMAIARAQNDFSDNNYKPKPPANTYSPPSYQVQSSSQTQTRRIEREQDGHWIDKWSGGARYYAEWEIVNNYIDDTSVCANHRRGSIDFRECRKGAKQFFKEQCKGWDERYQSDRKPWSDRMKQRYCSAASSFNPMG